MERKLRHNDTREVWKGMRTITGYKRKDSQAVIGDVDRANEFNLFYNRFDTGLSRSSPFPSPDSPPFAPLSPRFEGYVS